MDYVIYTIYMVTLILLIVFNIYIYHALISSGFGKTPPFVPTTGKRKKAVLDIISREISKSSKKMTLIDAGSGIGTILVPLAKKFPKHTFIGIEWSRAPYFVSKLRAKKLRNLIFLNDDIFNISFKEADIIYCYIVEKFKKPLEKKIISECKKNCLIITNGAHFENLKLVAEEDTSKNPLSKSVYIHKLK